MNKIINYNVRFLILVSLPFTLLFTNCERDISDDVTNATFAKTAEIFIDAPVAMGSDFYFPYSGSKPNAWSVDTQIRYSGSASMRFDVPNANDPDGNYAGAIFRVDGAGRDLTGYDALTFYAKASQGVTIGEFGFGEDFFPNKYITTLTNVSVGTAWTKYIIPIPDASKLVQERGMFRYAAGTQGTNGFGYTLWIDDLKFEKLGTTSLLYPFILNRNNITVNSFTGSSQVINQLGATYNLANGQNISVTAAPSYFNFISSNPNVATVNELGLVNVVGTSGTTVITATIGNSLAQGSLTITSNGSFPQPVTPTNPAANVRSVFSNAYTNVVNPNFTPNFGGSTTIATIESIAGNDVVRYTSNNFTGIMFVETPINATTMTSMHVDVYVQATSSVEFQIRDIGANQIIETNVNNGNPIGDDRDYRFTASGLAPGWNSINIPLAGNLTTQRNNIGAIILVGGPNFILDNIYFFF
jgi:hypothetical protein